MVRIDIAKLSGEFFDLNVFDNAESDGRIWQLTPAEGGILTIGEDRIDDMVRELRRMQGIVRQIYWDQDREKETVDDFALTVDELSDEG